jgi:hypothetical protein
MGETLSMSLNAIVCYHDMHQGPQAYIPWLYDVPAVYVFLGPQAQFCTMTPYFLDLKDEI